MVISNEKSISEIIFERKSNLVGTKENYSIIVVKVSFPSTTFYESQILKDNKVEFSRSYKNKYYAISKVKQFDADLVWYKDVKLLNKIIK